MTFIEFILQTTRDLALSIGELSLIIIPLMIVMQVMKDKQWLDHLTKYLMPLGQKMGIRSEGMFPLLVGILFGISYGSGVIIQSVDSGEMNGKDQFLVAVFLVLCHAVFEDTLVFAAVGANGVILLATRVFAAFVLTCAASRQYTRVRRKDYEYSKL